MEAFRLLKKAADPLGVLNPGKLLETPLLDENLRYGAAYQAKSWSPVMDFSHQAGFVGAVEQCNGAGVCRKAGGVMCPSFQATREEMHSTRGRANLLRALISGNLSEDKEGEEFVFEALSLCLACKGCKAECPSAVDMARLKYEFLEHYFRPDSGRRRPLSDYLFANIDWLGRLGQPIAPVINLLFHLPLFTRMAERLLGISQLREYPRLKNYRLRDKSKVFHLMEGGVGESDDEVIFLADPFSEYFDPEMDAGLAALRVLKQAGCRVHLLPVVGSGRTMLSKGFVKAAQRQALKVVLAIDQLDPAGKMPIIGVEPSEIYTLRDEYPGLLPGDGRVLKIAERVYMIDEFLVRPGTDKKARILRIGNSSERRGKVLLHGHCYQKAQLPAPDGFPNGIAATVAMLEAIGYQVNLIEAGCCGMAGAFGYELKHYDLSMRIGELALFPAIRKSPKGVTLAAAGISCQAQIKDGTGQRPLHPIVLL
jgi:Fe-S oxidoreductase